MLKVYFLLLDVKSISKK